MHIFQKELETTPENTGIPCKAHKKVKEQRVTLIPFKSGNIQLN